MKNVQLKLGEREQTSIIVFLEDNNASFPKLLTSAIRRKIEKLEISHNHGKKFPKSKQSISKLREGNGSDSFDVTINSSLANKVQDTISFLEIKKIKYSIGTFIRDSLLEAISKETPSIIVNIPKKKTSKKKKPVIIMDTPKKKVSKKNTPISGYFRPDQIYKWKRMQKTDRTLKLSGLVEAAIIQHLDLLEKRYNVVEAPTNKKKPFQLGMKKGQANGDESLQKEQLRISLETEGRLRNIIHHMRDNEGIDIKRSEFIRIAFDKYFNKITLQSS
ncbi:MAG: hypothetical protein P1V18_03455 [Candidatus Gracilibacteria bacterium]|nr:hypothetical protein [Candidatus Gracilibacteria bacterium]